MASDSSGEESAFADCASSGVDRGGKADRRRQTAMQEMLQLAGTRKQKRQAPGRGLRSPPDSAPPAAKRAAAAAPAGLPAGAGTTAAAVELSAAALKAAVH